MAAHQSGRSRASRYVSCGLSVPPAAYRWHRPSGDINEQSTGDSRALDFHADGHGAIRRRQRERATDDRSLHGAAGQQHLEHAGRHAAGALELRVDGHDDRCRHGLSCRLSAPPYGTADRSAFRSSPSPARRRSIQRHFSTPTRATRGRTRYRSTHRSKAAADPLATGTRSPSTATDCILYELYNAFPQASSWTADAGAIFDLTSNALRPSGWTSADAAGLPIMPGLVTYDEVLSGEIKHAIRFTAPQLAPRVCLAGAPLRLVAHRHAVSPDG